MTIEGIVAQLVSLRDDLRQRLDVVEGMLKQAKIDEIRGSKPVHVDTDVECEVCHKRFKTTGGLGSHKLAVHGIEGKSRRALGRQKAKERERDAKRTVGVRREDVQDQSARRLEGDVRSVQPPDEGS